MVLDLENINVGQKGLNKLYNTLDKQIVEYCKKRKIEKLRKPRILYTDPEMVKLLHGVIRYYAYPHRYEIILRDSIYGFYVTRQADNGLTDTFRRLKNKSNFWEYVKYALKWTPDMFPKDQHLIGINDTSILNTYGKIYAIDSVRFTPLSKKDLTYFYENLLKKQGLPKVDYEILLDMLDENDNYDNFTTATRKSFPVGPSEFFILENCPPTDPIIRFESSEEDYVEHEQFTASKDVWSIIKQLQEEIGELKGRIVCLEKEKNEYERSNFYQHEVDLESDGKMGDITPIKDKEDDFEKSVDLNTVMNTLDVDDDIVSNEVENIKDGVVFSFIASNNKTERNYTLRDIFDILKSNYNLKKCFICKYRPKASCFIKFLEQMVELRFLDKFVEYGRTGKTKITFQCL